MPVVQAGMSENGTLFADQFFLLMYEKQECVLNTLDCNLHL